MAIPIINDKLLTRAMKNTLVNPETGCWEYQGGKCQGYGVLCGVYLHVLSAKIFLGYKLTTSSMVCHKQFCKNKACWNPSHLYVGNAKSNVRDAIDTGARPQNMKLRVVS